MSEGRGYWYLLTGLIIGVLLGIIYSWSISPLEYTNTTPDTLRSDFKDEYRYLIALSHKTHGSLERSRARLGLLADTDPAAALGEQAQRMLAANAPMGSVRALADLSEMLLKSSVQEATEVVMDSTKAIIAIPQSVVSPQQTAIPVTDSLSPFEPILASTDTPEFLLTATLELISTLGSGRTLTATQTPSKSATPIATATLKPSLTPTATPGRPFEFVSQETFCEPTRSGLLQIYLENSIGDPASGIEITITWLGGDEQFFTGLKPELGYGYADFVMTSGVEYVLSLSNGVTRLSGLQAPVCDENAVVYPGGIRLKFRQP